MILHPPNRVAWPLQKSIPWFCFVIRIAAGPGCNPARKQASRPRIQGSGEPTQIATGAQHHAAGVATGFGLPLQRPAGTLGLEQDEHPDRTRLDRAAHAAAVAGLAESWLGRGGRMDFDDQFDVRLKFTALPVPVVKDHEG